MLWKGHVENTQFIFAVTVKNPTLEERLPVRIRSMEKYHPMNGCAWRVLQPGFSRYSVEIPWNIGATTFGNVGIAVRLRPMYVTARYIFVTNATIGIQNVWRL